MAVTLDAVIPVNALASGASVTIAHGLEQNGTGLVPQTILPDRATPIVVVSATSSSVTYRNDGASTETAIFWVHYAHSIQRSAAVPAANHYWQGAVLNSFLLNPPQWEDLRVPVTSTQAFGANPPTLMKFKDTGAVGAGTAQQVNGVNNTMVVGADFGAFNTSFSCCFWMVTTYVGAAQRYVIFKNASWDIEIVGGKIRVGINGLPNSTSSVPYLVGARNCVVVTIADAGGGVVTVSIYQNNVLTDTINHVGALPADNANLIYVTSNAAPASRFPGTLDELRIYQDVLTAAQVADYWALGAGTTAEPAGAPALLAGWHFDDGAGVTADNYEGTAARDLTITNGNWVTGLTTSAVTRGVYTFAFDPDVEQELFFTAQFPHGYAEGTDLYTHLHWSPSDAVAGNVRWGLEYVVKEVDGTFGNSAIISDVGATGGVLGKHILTSIGAIPGAGLKISSMLIGRVFRQAAAGTDTYANVAYLHEIDFHYYVNTLGSRQELVK